MGEILRPTANRMKHIPRRRMVFQKEQLSSSWNSMTDSMACTRQCSAMPMSTDRVRMLSERRGSSRFFSIRSETMRFQQFLVMVHKLETSSMSLMLSRQTYMRLRKISQVSIMWALVLRLRSISSGIYLQFRQVLPLSQIMFPHSERYSAVLSVPRNFG